VLAPESPERGIQAIDVRDLAAWIVSCAESRLTGVYDATGRVLPLGTLVDEVVAALGDNSQPVWAAADFLVERDVAYWSGRRSLPLWLPEDHQGMTAHNVDAAFANRSHHPAAWRDRSGHPCLAALTREPPAHGADQGRGTGPP